MSTITNFRESLDDFCRLSGPATRSGAISNSTGKHLDIYLYGVIGTKTLNDRTVLETIEAADKPSTIKVYLNTIGGSFSAGLAIHNTLKQHPAKVTAVNMGYCLSMGSLVLMAGDEIEAAENSLLMIHRSQGLSFGDVDDHTKAITIQKQHDQTLLTTYRHRMNKTDTEIMQLMKTETWYTAAQAKAVGLVDTITGTTTLDKSGAESGASDLQVSGFKNPPAAFLAPPAIYS